MIVTDRMSAALNDLHVRWKGKRRPKAFYLASGDWDEFIATEPPQVRTMFGNNPPVEHIDPAFGGIPVRPTKSKTSRVYDNTASGRALPAHPALDS